MLTLDEYQKRARLTAIYGTEYSVMYPVMGLAGEAGEVCNVAKKILRDDHGQMSEESKEKLIKEVSDCLWYIANLCSDLGVSLSSVGQLNLDKLESRQKRGVLGGSGDDR